MSNEFIKNRARKRTKKKRMDTKWQKLQKQEAS
jgi:hypothetical protein